MEVKSVYDEIQQNNTSKALGIILANDHSLGEDELCSSECRWTALDWATYYGNEEVRVSKEKNINDL